MDWNLPSLLTSGAEQGSVGHCHLQGLRQPVQGQLGRRLCVGCGRMYLFVSLVQQSGKLCCQRCQGVHLEQCQATEEPLLVENVGQEHEDLDVDRDRC